MERCSIKSRNGRIDMALTKLLCCISTLAAGCCVKQNAIEFAEVAGKSGVVSATLGAFDSSGVLHINLNEGITILQGAVYFYGIKEDASFMRSELFDELKEIAINTPMLGSIAGSTAFDETPLFDGERCWYNYGGSILPVSRITHGDEARFNREKMKNIPIESLDKCFDCSGGYHDIGYIVVAISYKDVEGVESVDFIILNRVGLRRLVAREVSEMGRCLIAW